LQALHHDHRRQHKRSTRDLNRGQPIAQERSRQQDRDDRLDGA
jgi:hypothetical protein